MRNEFFQGGGRFGAALLGLTCACVAHGAELTIAPGQTAEQCVSLTLADSLKYSFTSDVPVQFDVYYRQGVMVFHPVLQRNQRELDGTLVPEGAYTYCAAWMNSGDTAATVRYEVKAVRGGR